jgi:hypothetical protein
MSPATSLRLPAPLKAEAISYAEALGVSLNALCAVALRDYLDSRKAIKSKSMPPAAAASMGEATKGGQTALRAAPAARSGAVLPRVGPNAPCPCGSGQKYKRCHGKPGAAL